ncbi:hypothetical protein Gohar_000849 [Gossypium harknessii]|uniref:Uncharacterized protein n=1 Tax=Gossypium harknessii TaxID=34285 RepID=A0A7J9I1Z7_9ROSI|nr:hypothetical protein [Gossypium harknessii]
MISMENRGFNVRFMIKVVYNYILQDVKKSSEAEEMFGEYLGHEFNEERMLMETTDYPPPGPDPKHDPHAPPPPQP